MCINQIEVDQIKSDIDKKDKLWGVVRKFIDENNLQSESDIVDDDDMLINSQSLIGEFARL